MIISRAPVRITLGGGGTDLKSYYSKYGGSLIAASIDKYTFVTAHPRFPDDIRLKYSKIEQINEVSEIKHNIFPYIKDTALKYLLEDIDISR